jgi:hypothetical protein
MELTRSFASLLQEFACVFTAPSFPIFVALVTGWCLSFRHRYVTELIQASGSTHTGHHSRYHRFFSQAAWSLDELCCILARLLVAAFAATGFIELANDRTPWQTLVFDQFGLHATLQVKTRQALYYKAGGTRLLTIVLVHDVLGQRPDQMFYSTRLDWDARAILAAYACRWSIEVMFVNTKQLLGFEDPANRTPKAVERTAPMALVLYSLIVLWFHRLGHRFVRFPDRPWYRRKSEPSFADLLSTLRRRSWQEKTQVAPSGRRQLKKIVTQLTELVSRAA